MNLAASLHVFVRCVPWLLVVFAWTRPPALGGDVSGHRDSRPASFPRRYQVNVWQDKDGLPQNSVLAICRSRRDGYLWLGTVEGLVRFDGVRFTVFDRANTPELGNSRITALLEDRAGALWIGTAGGGLSRWQVGRFSRFTQARDGLSEDYITSLCEDAAGNLWVGTLSRGVNRWKDGRSTVFSTADGLLSEHVQALATDAAGAVWVGTDGGLARIRGEQRPEVTAFRLPGDSKDQTVFALAGAERADTLWVGTNRGLRRFEDGGFVPVHGEETFLSGRVYSVLRGRDGQVWAGAEDGGMVYRGDNAAGFHACETQDPLPPSGVHAFYEDPASGDLWLGTYGDGLVRLRHGRIGVYTTRDGLGSDFIRPIVQDAAGTVWVGTQAGVDRFEDGRFVPGTSPPENATVVNWATALASAGPTGLWAGNIGVNRGVYRLVNGQFVRQERPSLGPSVVIALHADRAGRLWVGTERELAAFATGENLAPLPLPDVAFTRAHVESFLEDRAGNVWIGTLNDGLGRFRDGELTTWTTAVGLPDNHVLGFYEDATGSLWIGTHGGGLVRMKDGKFTAITSKHGLYDDLAFAIVEDDFGNLWMSGNKGIYRASLAELNAFADGRITSVHSYGYGAADGMISRECNGASPAGWKMRDGTLWFPTIKGVVVVDPRQRNAEPPRMVIERVVVDRVPQPVGGEEPVTLRPGQEELEIQYTGLSWQRPPQVRFEFQLAGLDRGWTDAGTRRTAYFSHLPAGSYTFEVRADNGDGVWSLSPATVRVVVLPPFWQTWWFRVLAGALLAAAAGGGFWWRGRQLRRRLALQGDFSRRLIDAHETERRRVAAELHDGLGQTLAMLKNRALFATQNAHDLPTARRQIEQITEYSAQAISEVREIAYNLRPYLLDRLGLTKALRSMLHKVAEASGPALDVDIEDLDGLFSAEAEMSFYRIVQESVNNVLKHARATRAAVRVAVQAETVQITVEDNGRGFEVNGTSHHGDRPGFGLFGIAERVRLLDGTHSIESTPGRGTRLSIRLPYERRELRPKS